MKNSGIVDNTGSSGEILWKADLENGRYRNPILYADYSDPDVIRVEDTYYMTASSFNYTPGLPILTSKDLVNWDVVNYAVENIDYPMYRKPAHAKGIWAPAIRYHEGEFYIYYGMPDEGIFMVHTKDPYGPWSAPALVLEGKGLIDPCPLWDEDGNAYVVHGYARSRIGFKSILGVFPMSWDGTRATGTDHFIYDGTKTQITIEGPKIYKRDGWYYIFAPAGGVKTGWQTVLRSKDIYGPYEEKIVMRQGDTPINGPHQGGLVDSPDGREWFVHFQDKGSFGRITHLQPVVWREDGWPVIGERPDENGCGQPCLEYEKPYCGENAKPCYPKASDPFDEEKPGLMWQWSGNHDQTFWSMADPGPGLRLYSLSFEQELTRENVDTDFKQAAASDAIPKEMPLLWDCPNLLTQKLICPDFKAETEMDVSGLKDGNMAGLVMLGGQYAYLGALKTEGTLTMVYVQSEGEDANKKERVIYSAKLPENTGKVKLGLDLTLDGEPAVTMRYSDSGGEWKAMADSFCPVGHTWVGAKFGLFAVSSGKDVEPGFAEFSYMKVEAV